MIICHSFLRLLSGFQDGLSNQQIVDQLRVEGLASASVRTLQRKLQQSQLRCRVYVTETPALCAQIAAFYYDNHSDSEIMQIFLDCGLEISLTTVKRLCRKIGCVWRMTAAQRGEADLMLREVIQEQLDSGTVGGYGREMMLTHL